MMANTSRMLKCMAFLLFLDSTCRGQEQPELILPHVNSEPAHVVFSDNNKFLLTYSDKLVLWDAATARVLNNFDNGNDPVNFASFLENDLSILAVAGKKIIIRDFRTGQSKRTLLQHKDDIYRTQLNAGKNILVTLAKDNTLIIWNLATGTATKTISLPASRFGNNIQLNTSGSLLAVATINDRTSQSVIDLYNTTTATKIRSLTLEGFINHFRFTNSNDLLAATSEKMYLFNGKTWEASMPETDQSSRGVLAPGSFQLASVNGTDRMAMMSLVQSSSSFIDIYEGKQMKAKPPLDHEAGVTAFAYLDDSTLVSATTEGTICFWNTRTGTETSRVETATKGYDHSIAVSKDRKRFCLASTQDRQLLLFVFDAREKQLLAGYNNDIRLVSDIAISRNGDSILFNNERSLKLWNNRRVENVPTVNLLQEHMQELKKLLMQSGGGTAVIGNRPDELGEVYVDWKRKRVFTLHDLVRDSVKVWDLHTGDRLPLYFEKPIPFDSLRPKIREVFSKRDIPYSQYLGYHTVRMSENYDLFFTSYQDGTFALWDLNNNTMLLLDSIASVNITSVKFSEDYQRIYLVGDNDSLYRYHIPSRKTEAVHAVPPADENWVLDHACALLLDPAGKATELESGKTIYTLPDFDGSQPMIFNNNDSLLAYVSADRRINLWDNKQKKRLSRLQGHNGRIIGLQFAKNNTWLVSSSSDNTIKIWDLHQFKLIATFILFNESDFIIHLPSGYYMATRKAAGYLSFRLGEKLFPAAQFDLRFNRPDKVLEALGNTDTALLKLYKTAWEKRLKRLHLNETDLATGFSDLPAMVVEEARIPAQSDQQLLTIPFQAAGAAAKLREIRFRVNDIPVHDMAVTRQLSDKREGKANFRLLLNEGFNRIQASCVNDQGTESLRQTFFVHYRPAMGTRAPSPGSIHYVGIGVSHYKDSSMNLRYAAKDARDLDSVFHRQATNFTSYILTDDTATKENILAVKKKLAKTHIEDLVIVSVSGHGMLDSNKDFYFATYDMDFAKPALHGLLYDSLEALLSDIPARKKLLLIDACHSGEVDKDLQPVMDSSSGLKTYGAKGAIGRQKSAAGLQNSFELMRELFSDLNWNNGAIVVSAAGGLEYALEDPRYSNGVFTYCIKTGLLDNEADKDEDGKISINELRDHVSKNVERLTNGRQKPTSRKESLAFDWIIYTN